MAARDKQRQELPSVLDRLIDEDPDNTREKPRTLKELAVELRNAVRRDVEDLLNTRQRPLDPPEKLADLEESSFEFGIPDFGAANMSSVERRRLYLKEIQKIIQLHEPRFQSVRVLPVDERRTALRTLHFRIEAVLRTEPAPESVLYDSQVELRTRAFRIQL